MKLDTGLSTRNLRDVPAAARAAETGQRPQRGCDRRIMGRADRGGEEVQDRALRFVTWRGDIRPRGGGNEITENRASISIVPGAQGAEPRRASVSGISRNSAGAFSAMAPALGAGLVMNVAASGLASNSPASSRKMGQPGERIIASV